MEKLCAFVIAVSVLPSIAQSQTNSTTLSLLTVVILRCCAAKNREKAEAAQTLVPRLACDLVLNAVHRRGIINPRTCIRRKDTSTPAYGCLLVWYRTIAVSAYVRRCRHAVPAVPIAAPLNNELIGSAAANARHRTSSSYAASWTRPFPSERQPQRKKGQGLRRNLDDWQR